MSYEGAENLTSIFGSSGTIDGGICPTTPGGVPGWWSAFVDSEFLPSATTCSSQAIDQWASRLSIGSFLFADVCLFAPPLWRRWSQTSLQEIVQEEQKLQAPEDAAKAMELRAGASAHDLDHLSSGFSTDNPLQLQSQCAT